jgi:uncharacterized membrane protein
MSVAQATFTTTRSGSRWLLLGSLALNLFFVGIAVAMFIRAPEQRTWDRNVFVRVERLAATLPAADAQILRAAMDARSRSRSRPCARPWPRPAPPARPTTK